MFHWIMEGHRPRWTAWSIDPGEARRGNLVEQSSCESKGCKRMRFRLR